MNEIRWKMCIALVLIALLGTTATGCGDDQPVRPGGDGEQMNGDAGDGDLAGDGDQGSNDGDSEGGDGDSGNNGDGDGENNGDGDNGDDPEESCGLPAPFDEGIEYERELFVATTGSDSSGDGSTDNPFATLNRAASVATPGTRIVMREGNYAGGIYIQNFAGEPGRPVAVVADGEVVIQGGANNIQFVEPSYLVVEGLTFEGATANGLNIDDGSTLDTPAEYIVLRNLKVRGVNNDGNNDCIKLSGLRHFWVIDSEVQGCARGQGIDMVGCHEGIITGNRIADMAGPGIQAKGGSSNVVIHGNWFEAVEGRGINAGGSTSLPYFRPPDADAEARNIQTVANVFVDVGETSGAPIAFVGCDDCLFAHNTVVRPLTWVARILQESRDERFVPARDGRFVHNLIALNVDDLRNGVYVNFSSGTDLSSFTFARNLWFALDRETYNGPTYTSEIPPEQDSMIQEDPLFTDFDGQNFRLQPGSPALGQGDRELYDMLFPDYDGRCYDDLPALGAFEGPE